MDAYSELLLDVWREVGRHLEIQESIDRIGRLIGQRMPFESVLVRVLDVERSRVETLVRALLMRERSSRSMGRKRVKPS